MRSLKVIAALVAFAAFIAPAAAEPYATIAGRVHYVELAMGEEGDAAPAVQDGATVTLYKRTSAGVWAYVADTTTGADPYPEGFYIFEDIDIGTGMGGLFQHSDWCKIEVNAEGKIPGWGSRNPVVVRYPH